MQPSWRTARTLLLPLPIPLDDHVTKLLFLILCRQQNELCCMLFLRACDIMINFVLTKWYVLHIFFMISSVQISQRPDCTVACIAARIAVCINVGWSWKALRLHDTAYYYSPSDFVNHNKYILVVHCGQTSRTQKKKTEDIESTLWGVGRRQEVSEKATKESTRQEKNEFRGDPGSFPWAATLNA